MCKHCNMIMHHRDWPILFFVMRVLGKPEPHSCCNVVSICPICLMRSMGMMRQKRQDVLLMAQSNSIINNVKTIDSTQNLSNYHHTWEKLPYSYQKRAKCHHEQLMIHFQYKIQDQKCYPAKRLPLSRTVLWQ